MTAGGGRTVAGDGQRGLGLVELVVTAAVMLVVLLVVYSALALAQRWFGEQVVAVELATGTRAALDALVRELRSSGPARVAVPGPGQQSEQLVFQPRRELADPTGLEETDWDPVVSYRLREAPGENASNGVDDDGDGITDERQLVRLQSGRAVVILDAVLGVRFSRPPDQPRVDIELRVAVRDNTDPRRSHRETTRTMSVMLRNPER